MKIFSLEGVPEMNKSELQTNPMPFHQSRCGTPG